MSKHRLSDPSLPPAKRLCAYSGSAVPVDVRRLLTFDNSIYDELVLCIFSHLSWVDLCAVQATSSNWARLAADNELWRKQFLSTFGRPRLRGSRGFVARSDGKEVKPLPGRARNEEHKDWKWMFRISANWKTGRCRVEDVPVPLLPHPNAGGHEKAYQTHILLAGPLTVLASSQPSNAPEIHVTGLSDGIPLAVPFHSRSSSMSHITAMVVDQSPPISGHTRIATFLSTGEFAVHSINHSKPRDFTCEIWHQPSINSSRTALITKSVYHHPLLVTLSQAFNLSIYHLSPDAVTLTQSLSSFTSFPPSSLVLSTPSSSSYKLVLAYAIPVYPAHWSVGATELIINASPAPLHQPLTSPSSSFSQDTPSARHGSFSIRSTRTIRSIDVPQGWIDERKLRAMREQWGRKLSKIADTQTDGKWVVLAPGDRVPYLAGQSGASTSSTPSSTPPSNHAMSGTPMQTETGLQLYRLSLPPSSLSVSASPPKLTFVRTLHGQTGPVSALALADGRCVSLAHNGSIWVWDLENGTGAQVASRDNSASDAQAAPKQGTVVFDERRIISALASNVVVRRFDV
ncbi:hypothetical protein BKA70DRAFT_1181876 [Coprinopsis sp. MPI-PUGE-AT-0042]|nr:hypothetical protein BKA70DRAFT_1181876 [Coprinopsis sp. MPI-PUGE-AT-0042]